MTDTHARRRALLAEARAWSPVALLFLICGAALCVLALLPFYQGKVLLGWVTLLTGVATYLLAQYGLKRIDAILAELKQPKGASS